MPWIVYMLRCRDGSLYTGATNDLGRRLELHRNGRGAAYTRGRAPLDVVYGVETVAGPHREINDALRYLWRRERPDSGGPGTFRGGVGADNLYVDPVHIPINFDYVYVNDVQ